MPKNRTTRPKNQKRPKAKPALKTRSVAKTKPETVATTQIVLPSVWQLTRHSFDILWKNKRTTSFIVLIYGIAYLILVLGFTSPANVTALKQDFSGIFHGNYRTLDVSYNVFTNLLGSATSSSSSSGSGFQAFIFIVSSLAIIWALRQFYQGTKIKARDSFYQGMYPLIKYLLVLLFVGLELLPLLIGLGMLNLFIGSGIAVNGLEQLIVIVAAIALALLSLYLVSSSLIALYIVCLPDVTPMKALRSAKALVKGRRLLMIRKLVFLPIMLVIVSAVIMLPLILVIPAIAGWLYFLLILLALAYINSYLYSLYRGLINE